MSKIDDDRLPPPARCLPEPKPDLGDRRRPPELCIASSSPVTRSTHNVFSVHSGSRDVIYLGLGLRQERDDDFRRA